MPYDDPDPRDPMMLVGVALPATAEAQREMVYALAEEFARLGFDEERILALFRRPFYAGAHAAFRQLGEREVRRIVGETLAVWGRARPVDRDRRPQEIPSPPEERGRA